MCKEKMKNYSRQNLKRHSQSIFEVDLSGLPAGVYFLPAGDEVVRIVKE